jgi:predicted DsbA family dithiol-disulfide isomerase
MDGVRVTWFTDPACPWSWAAEPERRRLEFQFGEALSFTYVMAGLARRFEDPLASLRQWLQASAERGMPLDPRLWLDAPPASSYPACLAVKAAGEQGLDAVYLRHAREAFAVGRRRLDNADALVALAREVPGLDVARFAVDLDSHAIVEAFGADLDRSRAPGDEDAAPATPWADFEAADGSVQRVTSPLEPGALEAAAMAAGAQPLGAPRPGPEAALRRFGRMATAEVAAVCDLPGPQAPAQLWQLAADWRVRANGPAERVLWSIA